MPTTYTLISSTTIATSGVTALVSLTNIDQTYTDLVLRMSLRSDTNVTFETFNCYLRSTDGTNLGISQTYIYGNGASAASTRLGTSTPFEVPYMNAGNSTSNTFTSLELYIPNYSVAGVKKAALLNYASETNATTAYINNMALLIGNANTSAVGRFLIDAGSGYFRAGSSFYLYGISNA
jgi:hypothetical protein